MYSKFLQRWIGGKKFDIIIITNLFTQLLKNLFAEGIDGFRDLNLDNNLVFARNNKRLNNHKDSFGEILLGSIDEGSSTINFGLDNVNNLILLFFRTILWYNFAFFFLKIILRNHLH